MTCGIRKSRARAFLSVSSAVPAWHERTSPAFAPGRATARYVHAVAGDLRYEPPPELDRPAIERGLHSSNADEQIGALHAAVFRDDDPAWVLGVCLRKLRSPDRTVRLAAASFVATFLQMRRYATLETREALLEARQEFPELRASLDDALDGLTRLST